MPVNIFSGHFSQKGVPVNIFRGPFSRKEVQVSIISGPFSLLLKCLEDLSKNSIVPARAIYDLDIYCYLKRVKAESEYLIKNTKTLPKYLFYLLYFLISG